MPYRADLPRLARAARQRADQHRFWNIRTKEIEEAMLDGWSTWWISRRFNLLPELVRQIRRELELEGVFQDG